MKYEKFFSASIAFEICCRNHRDEEHRRMEIVRNLLSPRLSPPYTSNIIEDIKVSNP